MPFAFLITTTIAIILLVLPGDAFAWGPATHLDVGLSVLSMSGAVFEPVRLIIERFPQDFLYGNISADIVVGKNLVEELKHCHNWRFGFKLLRGAESDCQRAFAYGYLSHLAADTVAHNHYIPEMMVRSFSARTLRHIYWEMRFDSLAEKKTWLLAERAAKEAHPEDDKLLDSIIEDAPFSFRTNKTIFSGILTLHRIERWRRMLRILSSSSRWRLNEDDRVRFLKSSVEAALSLLNLQARAACFKKDPTGRQALNAAKALRKTIKSSKRRGMDWRAAVEEAIKHINL